MVPGCKLFKRLNITRRLTVVLIYKPTGPSPNFFKGYRYVRHDDNTTNILYDCQGRVAGVQTTVRIESRAGVAYEYETEAAERFEKWGLSTKKRLCDVITCDRPKCLHVNQPRSQCLLKTGKRRPWHWLVT
jgi:hypothetical protein